jgi:hypothetical protein
VRVLENRALRIRLGLRVGEIKGLCRKLLNEQPRNLYTSIERDG